MALERYRSKRDFKKTAEPGGKPGRWGGDSFVIQKHAARALHYDFRLELDGVLKSWAVPKGPSLNPADKRLAIEVEDHPLVYGGFEGTIPKGQYGGGNVIIWDKGRWQPEGDARAGYKKGRLAFTLEGVKLHGKWNLVRKAGQRGEKAAWFLIKGQDGNVKTHGSIVAEQPESVVSGREVEEVDKPAKRRARAAPKVAGAQKSKPPAFATPMLPSLVDSVPKGERWQHEIKYDGYRLLIYKQGKQVRMLTRKGLDWTRRFGTRLEKALQNLPYKNLVLDGEVVALDENSVSNFAQLQEALASDRPGGLVLYLFDILHADGLDYRSLPLEKRREVLEKMLGKEAGNTLQLSGTLTGNGPALFKAACEQGLEGIISKNWDSPYASGRVHSWVKTKCHRSGTFIIVGYSTQGKRALRSLVMAEKIKGKLCYIGRVGAGFNACNLEGLLSALERLQTKSAPLKPPRGAKVNDVLWVKPELLAEIEFRARTGDNILRQASFKGLRPDKQNDEKVLELMEAPDPQPRSKPAKGRQPSHLLSEDALGNITITHPERRLFGDEEVSKLDVAVYAARVADWMLPHILKRPLSLIRCTSDNKASCFYQRHATMGLPNVFKKVKLKEDKGKHGAYLYFDQPEDFLKLAQHGVVEVHPWNCHVDDAEHPDQIIFDLDPDVGLGWGRVVEGALVVKDWLEQRGFGVFVKTTGGKGAHLVLPLKPQLDWDGVKALSKRIAEKLAYENDKRFTAHLPKASRKGKIFLDYLRNGRSATAVAPYSLRARPGAPVALPLSWEAFRKVKDPQLFTFETVPPLLEKRADPWADFGDMRIAAANTRALLKLKRG
jgi:bifunctional non-homologous end joining protein LigD